MGDLIERLQSHMGKADMGEVLADCRLAADELTALREALRDIVTHFEPLGNGMDGPGHSHDVPGIWDNDNAPEIAGKPCEWCATWNAARAHLLTPESDNGRLR